MAGALEPGNTPPPKSGRTFDYTFVKNGGTTGFGKRVESISSDPVFHSSARYGYQTWLDTEGAFTPDLSLNKELGVRSTSPLAYLDAFSGYNQKNTGWISPLENKDTSQFLSDFGGQVYPSLSDEDLEPWRRSYDDSDLGPAQGNWDIPTSTTNFKRPRTVAAGYDRNQQLLTVVFRDGTFWNYYDVTQDEWIKFHQAYSKGPFLNKGGSIYENHRGDAADMSSMSPEAQQFFVAVSRAAQITFRESPGKKGSLTGSQPLRSKNRRMRNEYERQRRARNRANAAAAANTSAGKNPSKNGKNPAGR